MFKWPLHPPSLVLAVQTSEFITILTTARAGVQLSRNGQELSTGGGVWGRGVAKGKTFDDVSELGVVRALVGSAPPVWVWNQLTFGKEVCNGGADHVHPRPLGRVLGT